MEEIMKVSEKALYRRPLVNCCWPFASQFGHVYCSNLRDVLCMCPLADFNGGPFAASWSLKWSFLEYRKGGISSTAFRLSLVFMFDSRFFDLVWPKRLQSDNLGHAQNFGLRPSAWFKFEMATAIVHSGYSCAGSDVSAFEASRCLQRHRRSGIVFQNSRQQCLQKWNQQEFNRSFVYRCEAGFLGIRSLEIIAGGAETANFEWSKCGSHGWAKICWECAVVWSSKDRWDRWFD